MNADEENTIARLARSLAHDREMARGLSMPFASRLLDLCLLEVAMVWQGREAHAASPSASAQGDALDELLRLKMRLSIAERAPDSRSPPF